MALHLTPRPDPRLARRLVPRRAALAALALLAACAGPVPQAGPATLSTQGTPDPILANAPGGGEVAKALFGAAARPSAQSPEPIGATSRGCQAGAVALPESGPTWQAMRLSRNRNWAQPVTVSFVQDLSRFAATLPGWTGLYVGDLSQPRGGPMTSGHASHQSGLDVDVWLNPPARMDLSTSEREAISASDFQRASGAYVAPTWTPAHEALVRRAAEDPRVARIFIFAGAKVEMCENATGDRAWLRKVRPWYGHNDHIHVRLNCPAGARFCQDQDPIPPGDGCADAASWVQGILNPPDPDPTPAPRRPDLTLADLPAQCAAVLASP
jgi:penicillin-insensitive murein endopeptidase